MFGQVLGTAGMVDEVRIRRCNSTSEKRVTTTHEIQYYHPADVCPHDLRQAVNRKLIFLRIFNVKICEICIIAIRRSNCTACWCPFSRTDLSPMWCSR
jgi:hypothetical protein